MTTTSIKQQIIIHKFKTLSDEPKNILRQDRISPFHNVTTQRSREILSISKVHNSLKCNKQKRVFVPDMSHLKVMSKRGSKKKFDGYDKKYRFKTEIQHHRSSRIKNIQKSDTKTKIKKIFLPNLKNFDDFDYQTDRIKLSNTRQIKKSIERYGSQDKQTNFPQTITPLQISPTKVKQAIVNSERKQQNYLPINIKNLKRQQKIYKYIEKVAKSDNGNLHKKLRDDDSSRAVSQFSPTFQKESNIIFHNFKAKGLQQAHVKNRETKIQSQPLFNISKIKQNLDQFLMKYTPLNPHFDLKQFIRNPNIQIITTQRSIFAGQLINNIMQGKGVLMTQKQLFQGQFVNNFKRQGFQKNKNGIYQGFYELGKRSGNGIFIWKNGQSYEGDWKFGKKNGHGIWKSPKGDYYEGEWKDNLQNGKGFYYHKGCSIYRGYFKNSLKQGRGQEQFENGEKYQGQYSQGKPHGYGKYVWANGDTYQGCFFKGSREGKGILRKSNGDVYQGQFKQDLKDGYGKQTFQKGEYFQGYFQKGLKVSGSYFTKDNKVIQSF